MDINGLRSTSYQGGAYEKDLKNQSTDLKKEDVEQVDAVYEKSTETDSTKKATYSPNTNVISKLKEDAEARTQQLRTLVEKLITKQGDVDKKAKLGDLSLEELVKTIKDGDYEVDEETIAKAKEDISDNGYWGVKQTSERIVSFAMALTGGDPSKIKEMREAVDKGFKEAEKVWGGELPEISQKTKEAVTELFDKWEQENVVQ